MCYLNFRTTYNNFLKERGLNYNGWFWFIIKRWLLRHKLGFLVPFMYMQDDYHSGVQTLYVYRWGVLTVEYWQWNVNSEDFHKLDRLKRKGVINQSILYKFISVMAVLIRKEFR